MPASDVVVTATVATGAGGGAVYTYAATVADTKGTATVEIAGTATALEVGSTVSFSVTPKTGYAVTAVAVTDANNVRVPATSNNGIYTFVMPASAVTITVTTTNGKTASLTR